MRLLQFVVYCLIGFILYNAGIYVNDWRFWGIAACVLAINFTFYISLVLEEKDE